MPRHNIFKTAFAKVYPMYVQKAERKSRTKDEVDQIICWLTGYAQRGLEQQIEQQNDFETFFGQAPAFHPNSSLIKGVVWNWEGTPTYLNGEGTPTYLPYELIGDTQLLIADSTPQSSQ